MCLKCNVSSGSWITSPNLQTILSPASTSCLQSHLCLGQNVSETLALENIKLILSRLVPEELASPYLFVFIMKTS